jgi:uncharacterized protein (UPF0332 family)
MDDAAEVYIAKAEESLEGAESELGNHRYNNCANRCYDACFQAAIYAVVQAGAVSADRDQWRHEFVQGQFVGQLINRRHLYPPELRDVLSRNLLARQRADYENRQISQTEARRAF